jgi:hypothetical protein
LARRYNVERSTPRIAAASTSLPGAIGTSAARTASTEISAEIAVKI